MKQHELQKQQEAYEKQQQQNILKSRIGDVESFEQEMKLLK
jgi:hypothetical protein